MFVGIDLGTTHSEIAVLEGGRPRVLGNAEDRILPSVVGLATDGGVLVGRPARNQRVLFPERTVVSVKRHMGSAETFRLGDRDYTAPEVSALILRRLMETAARETGREARQAVVTVPAYFNDAQRQATRRAGELAGLEVLRLLNEPTAAALAFGTEHEETVLVYDLGGGTFDVSVVESCAGVLEVRASHGDTQLGGDDFDRLLVDMLAARFQERHGLDLREDRRTLARLTAAAEKAKIDLSAAAFATVAEEFVARHKGKALHLEEEISREEFLEALDPMLQRTLESVAKVLEMAGVDSVSRVVLVGGSTRIPEVRTRLEAALGAPCDARLHPEESVALGAALQAGLLVGEEVETILVDVTPHSLGIDSAVLIGERLVDDLFSPVIPRNTALPASCTEVFHRLHPSQELLVAGVYQGEARTASQNARLGEVRLEFPGDEKEGRPEILVRFDVDLDGLVKVEVQDRSTGARAGTTVRMDSAGGPGEAEARPLPALSGGGADPRVAEVEALIARARQVLEDVREPSAGERLERALDELERALGAPERLPEAEDRLLEELYELEA